jgi:hypothetical protein
LARSGKPRRAGQRPPQRARARRRNKRAASAAPVAATDTFVETLEIRGELGSHALEALRLELRRLATRCGFEVTDIRIETDAEGRSG